MQLSIIILNYNVAQFLELCLCSVQRAIVNLDAEIIVVDNNSSDNSCERVKANFPRVHLVENDSNFGFPKGNNIGVAAAKGEYICILNPDTVVAEDTFEKILTNILQRQAENPASLGITGCKLIDGTGKFLPESKRGTPTPFVALTKIFGLYKIHLFFGKYYAQHLSENQSGEVDILVGAFMLMKRNLYLEIGGFDEDCFMYSDDIDLSYMVLRKELINYYYHETSVIHYKGESTIKDKTFMARFQQAMNFFYKKHFKVSRLFSIFMSVGIVFFSIFKKFQGKSLAVSKPEHYYLLSDDSVLKENLKKQLKSDIAITEQAEGLFTITKSEIIFDNNYIDFKSIIAKMEHCKNKGHTYKIIPKNANFMVGSNSSDTRGEVIFFEF